MSKRSKRPLTDATSQRAILDTIKVYEDNLEVMAWPYLGADGYEAKVAATGKDIHYTPADMPLCKLYIGQGCEKCPVALETGEQYCVGTPIQAMDDMFEDNLSRNYPGEVEWIAEDNEIVERAIAYLFGLMPDPGVDNGDGE
jgi:hypothetical protein